MKILAYFLPQFYHTPENDLYWGKGLTEWENVRSAKPLFTNHRIPLEPNRFGYYDLSDIENIQKISKYSLKQGIDGFGYWHYWLGNGKQTLEKVPEMHLSDRSIKQNYFFAWANTSWTQSWKGDDETIIFNQKYSKKSAEAHYKYLRKFLQDDRYTRLESKPIFQVINPNDSGVKEHMVTLEELAIKEFGCGFHWLFSGAVIDAKFQGLCYSRVGYPPGDYASKDFIFKIKKKLMEKNILKGPLLISDEKYLSVFKKTLHSQLQNDNFIPCLLSGWDNTPRYKRKGFLIDSKISSLLQKQFDILLEIFTPEKKIEFIFIKAWNEWAEGNILEPYLVNGKVDNPSLLINEFKRKLSYQ